MHTSEIVFCLWPFCFFLFLFSPHHHQTLLRIILNRLIPVNTNTNSNRTYPFISLSIKSILYMNPTSPSEDITAFSSLQSRATLRRKSAPFATPNLFISTRFQLPATYLLFATRFNIAQDIYSRVASTVKSMLEYQPNLAGAAQTLPLSFPQQSTSAPYQVSYSSDLDRRDKNMLIFYFRLLLLLWTRSDTFPITLTSTSFRLDW